MLKTTKEAFHLCLKLENKEAITQLPGEADGVMITDNKTY